MMAEQEKEPYYFNISLSILNHLGRDLYRNFITVLGEAISNSWDAGAKNVWIAIDKENGCFSIKDDGHGMSETDFRKKFLNVGYSRREDDNARAPEGRPLIGGKGIGKLALLSCAQRIHIMSKTSDTEYIGAIIDNGELDIAIDNENKAESKNYELAELNEEKFKDLKNEDKDAHGTILYFENMNDGIINTIETLRKLIAMHFRFSLVDQSFSILVNDDDPNSEDLKEVTYKDLKDISKKTEFLWTINEPNDPFLEILTQIKEPAHPMDDINANIKGFIATVEKPSHLNIFGASEKTGVDVFVNGRLREANILKHAPAFSTRIVASYLYGQIHLDILDDANSDNNEDRFTTSREGIKPEDSLYKELLEIIKDDILSKISTQWDKWRLKHGKNGDPDETGNLSKHQRGLKTSKEARDNDFKKKIDSLKNVDNATKISLKETLHDLAYKNTQVYQDLFILENLLRKFLEKNCIHGIFDFRRDTQTKDCLKNIKTIKGRREASEAGHALKNKIIKENHILNYLDILWLSMLVDKVSKNKTGRYAPQTMEAHVKEILPIRNVVMHTNEVSKDVMDWDKIKNLINLLDDLLDKP